MSNGGSAEPRGVSPASSGPAGSHFEAQVGASYLLAMLTGGEPRGLPGMVIDGIELQRASEGRPLDDVIVHAHDASGTAAVLEIQVKREVAFSPGDDVFRDVVQQIAAAARRPDFWTTRYELAVATAKTSARIAGPYQDVLTWARQLGSATTFMQRINRPGSANDNMRTFVGTFHTRLQEAGAPHDDETVWGLIDRLRQHPRRLAAGMEAARVLGLDADGPFGSGQSVNHFGLEPSKDRYLPPICRSGRV